VCETVTRLLTRRRLTTTRRAGALSAFTRRGGGDGAVTVCTRRCHKCGDIFKQPRTSNTIPSRDGALSSWSTILSLDQQCGGSALHYPFACFCSVRQIAWATTFRRAALVLRLLATNGSSSSLRSGKFVVGGTPLLVPYRDASSSPGCDRRIDKHQRHDYHHCGTTLDCCLYRMTLTICWNELARLDCLNSPYYSTNK
jgi:hypothetical protein